MTESSIRISKIQITENTIAQIVALRHKAYLWKFGQKIGSATFSWTELDALSLHFGAFNGDRLISTIRLSKFISETQFQRILMYPFDDPFSQIPSWACSKAATALDWRGISLNMILRMEVLCYLSSKTNFTKSEMFLYGTAKHSSRRLKYMKELGYEFVPGKIDWTGYIPASKATVTVFRLHSSQCEAAIGKIRFDLLEGRLKADNRFFSES